MYFPADARGGGGEQSKVNVITKRMTRRFIRASATRAVLSVRVVR